MSEAHRDDDRVDTEAALRKREGDLARVQRIAGVGGLAIDIAGGLRGWRSPEYLHLHGLPEHVREETHAEWRKRVHPEDRERAERALFAALEGAGTTYDNEYRIIRPSDGAVRWIQARAEIERDATGNALRLVGAHIDVTEQKEAQQALSESEERYRGVLNSMAEGFTLLDGDFTILEVNEATLRLDGRSREELVGRSHWDAFPGTRDAPVGKLFIQIVRERIPASLEHEYNWPDGRSLWVDMRAYPSPEGGVAIFWRDITDRKRANEALSESEQRYRSLFESMDEAYAVVEVLRDDAGQWHDFRFLEVNPAFMLHTGMPYPVGQTATELLGTPNPRWTQLYGEALDTGRPIRIEEDEAMLDRVFDLNIFSLDRELNRVAVLFNDVTERKRAEKAIRESEERLRSAVQVGGLGLWDWNVATGEVHWSDEHYHLQGYGVEEITPSYQAWTDRIHPEDREAAEEAIWHAMETGEEYTRELRTVYPDGSVHWVSGRGRFFYDEEGRAVRMIGATVDTTERREAEERQKVLLAELQHRVRNILAVVRSVFTRTADDDRTIAEVTSHFTGRLDSLARTQVLVTQNSSGLVDLEALVRDEMLSVGSPENPKVRINGPEVALPAREAEAIGLAIHELTTNAIKYGALSARGGALEISWAVNMHHREQRRLVLNWTEQGVPAVPVIPSNQGFGSELIREALPYRLGAATRLEFVGGGVRCEIALDLPADAKVLG